MELSIIIPTLRPNIIKETIQRIYDTTKNLDYEILIVSSLDMTEIAKLPKVRIIKETSSTGSNSAIELGVNQSFGTYVMELSDDNLIDTGCLENMVKFMRLHDKELLLCGPRVHDLWEIHPENTIYGFYYPKTPCIKKSNLEKIGKFYDTSFHSYFADPDLALRVIANLGKIEICPDAWIEFHNIRTDGVKNDRNKYFDMDSHVFLERWKPIYGKRVSNPNRTDIVNLGGIHLFKDNNLPNEYCSRIYSNLKAEKWDRIEIDNEYICSPYLLPSLLGCVMVFAQYIPLSLKKKLTNILELKIKNMKTVFSYVDFVWILTKIKNPVTIFSYFGDIKKYRLIKERDVINVANYIQGLVNDTNFRICS